VLLAWLLYPVVILIPVWFTPEPFRYFRQYYFASALFPLLAACLGASRRGMLAPATAALLAWSGYQILRMGDAFFLVGPR
jgi:hypothetical protein